MCPSAFGVKDLLPEHWKRREVRERPRPDGPVHHLLVRRVLGHHALGHFADLRLAKGVQRLRRRRNLRELTFRSWMATGGAAATP